MDRSDEIAIKLDCVALAIQHTKSNNCSSETVMEIAKKFYEFVKTNKEN